VAAAAGVAIPATGRRGPNNTWHKEVLGTLGTRLGRSGGGGTGWNHELAVGGANGRVRTGRRHRRCSSARGRVTSLYRWRVCSLATGVWTGGGASGERAAGRHRSDRGSRRGGTATEREASSACARAWERRGL
jgi:hypothetical protein